jgi:hypothetical protein
VPYIIKSREFGVEAVVSLADAYDSAEFLAEAGGFDGFDICGTAITAHRDNVTVAQIGTIRYVSWEDFTG